MRTAFSNAEELPSSLSSFSPAARLRWYSSDCMYAFVSLRSYGIFVLVHLVESHRGGHRGAAAALGQAAQDAASRVVQIGEALGDHGIVGVRLHGRCVDHGVEVVHVGRASALDQPVADGLAVDEVADQVEHGLSSSRVVVLGWSARGQRARTSAKEEVEGDSGTSHRLDLH